MVTASGSTVAADPPVEVQLERLRTLEALAARDATVLRLEDAYNSIRQKAAIISQLERELDDLKQRSTPSTQVPITARTVSDEHQQCSEKHDREGLGNDINLFLIEAVFAYKHSQVKSGTRSLCQEDTLLSPPIHLDLFPHTFQNATETLQSNSAYRSLDSLDSTVREPFTPAVDDEAEYQTACRFETLFLEDDVDRMIATRRAILAALPLPSSIPDDALQPITLPLSYSLHDFLRNITGSVKNLLKNHRILAQPTTYWCPDREEHGYFLTPMFKCSTNPRVVTAHQWSAVDVIDHMSEATACFYNKDGRWYYAGTYKAFRMDDLTPSEWQLLSTETTQALIKETLANRKNVSPQNHYEIGQLYSVGALRVACVGLQCIDFNDEIYHGILEQSRFVHWTRLSGWNATSALSSRQDSASGDAITLTNTAYDINHFLDFN